ncbi:SusC/RagA family TonB-linked outer membrane protein [Sphingobacterium psychroaquaticum]|uniref:SusC/RagA family TonB-linked outer membrane protein n=1 Tax=Sphingobacterium psychroaquaticum TaxID=561061 RepID=UPI00106AC922|nr:SusC/RagA family TonB-linked outer membrane protein [Sphingobacterium psychroaquaticum]QBQ42285.1 SusC/RagA family TonB-linked outer membrane protein [Sphingobacterium psychroaquaticum]
MKNCIFKFKDLRKHRLCFFVLLIVVLSTNSALAQIRVSIKQKPLTTVFKAIESQSDFVFLYDKDVARVSSVTLNCSNCSIEEIVKQLAKETDLDFRVNDKQILVKRKNAPKKVVESAVLTASTVDSLVGRVVDEHGQPIVGATLLIKGTKIGTSSNQMGYFALRRPEKGVMVMCNIIGYHPQEVVVADQKMVMLRLVTKAQKIEDVVISTGLQKRERSKLVGNVSSIKGEDLEGAGITTVDKALRGKMTGVYVRSNSGRPGEAGSIVIRGSNTMTGSAEPLIILDGMPMQNGEVAGMDKTSSNINSLLTNGIGNIPPEDIATIDILRDATAASVYGARAANGVIVITTKRGVAGKDYINYSTKQGLTLSPKNGFDFMNSSEKLAYERQLYNDFHPVYGGRAVQLLLQADNGVISREQADQEIAQLGQVNTDWINVLYNPAYQQSHNVSMSGGSTKLQYNVSLNYQDANGTLMENKNKQGGMSVKLTRNVNDRLLIDFNLYSTIKKNVEGQSALDPFRYAMFANPYEKPFNTDGSYAWDKTYRDLTTDIGLSQALNYETLNIVKELRENTLSTDYNNVRGQFGVEWKFLDGFQYRGSAVLNYTNVQTMDESRGGTYRSYATNWLNTARTVNSGGGILAKYNQGFLEENSGKTIDYTVRNTIEYNKTFQEKHYVQAFLANEVSERTNNRFFHYNPVYLQDYRMAGYPSWDDVPPSTSKKLALDQLGGTYYEKDRSVSFISSFAYAYANRYVLNANFRSDGVDIIGSKNQFTPLWSAGLKWNAHEEVFVKENMSWLNRLVFSFGYGYTGSINRTVYPFHTYKLTALVYDDVVKAQEFVYGNPVLKWERKRDINYGVQFSVFNSRLNVEANYYDNKVTDLLDKVVLPASVGRTSSLINAGILSNKGWELSARVEAVKTTDWLWEIGGNLTTVKNNLDRVYYKKTPTISNLAPQNVENYALRSWFGYKYDHIDPNNGHMMVQAQRIDAQGTVIGDEIIDLSKISSADLQTKYRTYYLGQQDPKLYGGFNTRVRYKNVTFASNFVFAHGNMIKGFQDRREGPSGMTDDITAGRTNRLKNQIYRWRQHGDITDIPFYSPSKSYYSEYLVDRDIESGAYIKCTELGVNWRANPTNLGRCVKQLQIGLMANNLFTISPYSGSDPETQMAFGYPTTPSYTFSLNIGF